MFVSMNLQVTSRNVYHDMLEYDVYNSNHNYYITERYVAMHLLQIQKTKEHFFIIQNINTENKIWDNLNNKRLKLYKYLKG